MTFHNPELQSAEEFVSHTDRNIFLTGKAGTGKTTFLHAMKKKTHKRLVVTAPTGVAAINAGGVTIHSFFQLPFGPFVPGSEIHGGRHRVRREKKDIIRSLDLLVIDEISMVRADLLDQVDSVLRRYRRYDMPFGGVQLLMIGDLHQLSPVVKKEEWRILENYYDSPYFFSSTALGRTELIPIELKHIYRQSDQRFIDLLNSVRDNNLGPTVLEQLNARHIPDFSPGDEEGYITLCTHNRSADIINRARLKELPGKGRRFQARLEGDFPEHAYPTAAVLELKKGAQVMFIRNDMSADKAFYNGKIGKITGMSDHAVEVRCPEDSKPIKVEQTTWENMEYTVDPKTAEISQKVIGAFSQYPLKHAWAITIHKSQGLTFEKAVIDAQAAFAYGQVYVALSRCRSLEGMVLSSPITPIAVKTDHKVLRFVNEAVNNPPSLESLRAAKSIYQQRLLLECFSFEELDRSLGRLEALLRMHAKAVHISGRSNSALIRRQVRKEIFEVGEKFKRQLKGMFKTENQPSADPAIVERLTKASGYFQEKFVTILSPFLDDLRVETDNKSVRQQIRNAEERLRRQTSVKLAGVMSCRNGFSPGEYLRALSVAAMRDEKEPQATSKAASPAYTEADVGHPELFEALRQWRKRKAADERIASYQVLHQKTLVQIAVHLPDTIADLKRVKGIGNRLAARYGEELVSTVADYRRKHGINEVILPDPAATETPEKSRAGPVMREDTKAISLTLFRQGLNIPQIASERGLAASTIEGHLAHWVSMGALNVGEVVDEVKRRTIERQIARMQGEPLSTIKASLGNDFSYGEIKLVLAHLEHMEQR